MNCFVLHLRDREVGGSVTSGQLDRVTFEDQFNWNAHLDDFFQITRGQRLIVVTHGYNVSWKKGNDILVAFMKMLPKLSSTDPMLAVLWPGDGWAKALTYPFEGRDADDTASALFKWLITNVDNTARIAFVGHSLGCRVVMSTAKKLAQYRRGPSVDRICLMAPAIDNDALGLPHSRGYRDATLMSDRIAVLASEQDQVLRYAYPLGDLAQCILYGERWGRALGRTGPIENDTDVCAKIEPIPKADPARNINHGDYLKADPMMPTSRIMADTESFVFHFIARVTHPKWRAQRPRFWKQSPIFCNNPN